jgi:hypothetical protein
MKELINLQQTLKAPKNQYNKFGDYHYRSCEDILEALKPLLKKEKCFLTISDNISLVGDWHYVEVQVTLFNSSGESISVTAAARETEERKKSDASQLTGAASSYARKYALSGLFLLDDTKDADATNKHDTTGQPDKKAALINATQQAKLVKLIKEVSADVEKMCAYFKINYDETQPDSINIKGLQEKDFAAAVSMLEAKKGAK